MSVTTSTNNYWISSNALAIELNTFGDPDYIQVSVLANAVILAYYPNIITFNAAHDYRSWNIQAANTRFETTTRKYVYARLTRAESSKEALIVYPDVRLDIYGNEIVEGVENENTEGDYFYIYLGTISASVSETGETIERYWETQINFGMLSTDQMTEEQQKIDIIRTGDLRPFTDDTVLSALRSLEEFVSAKKDQDIQGILNFLNGLKINGNLLSNVITSKTEAKEYKDTDILTALRVINEISERALSKIQEDETNFLIKFLGGVLIKGMARFGDFITGMQGGYINEKGEAELEKLYLRSELIVPAIRYNYMTYFMGYNLITPGGGLKVKDFVDNGDGTWTVTPGLEEGMPCGQYVDDILLGYWYDKDEQTGDFAGFRKVQFRVVSVDYDEKTFVMSPRPDTNSVPYKEMKLGQTGNFTNENRQTYMILDVRDGNNCITFFDHANTWDPEPAQIKSWLGKKKGMTVAGINCDNYSAVLQNILMTGLIFQIDEITGDSVRVPIDKGAWSAGKYAYYNRVSHNGALWLCVATEGTEEEPGTGNAWLKQVAEGQKGDPGLSVVGGGHWESSKTPYEANTLVSFYNCVFISNVKTSNPPIAIARFKDGSYIRQKNGGYILAGRSADFTVHPDWTMLLDGRELKGTSITFLGSFATAPSNPVEGNSYYNTTDKCTYIYQNGQWMLMVSDGKDGRDYEYIYTRNNSIGITPDKPDSKQQDDYVPEGWTDDFMGVSETFQVEWGCKRTKRDGVWSEWSDPAIVHRWSKDGVDGTSIEAVGHWEASKTPYTLNQLVNFGRGTFVALEETSEPPLPIARFKDGTYMRKKDGGYILAGRSADMTVNPSWRMMSWSDEAETLYWLDCPISAFSYTSTGSPSPSSVEVTCKMSRGGSVSDCVTLWLVARRYNGSWVAHVGATQSSKIAVPATAGYTQFVVRAYKSSSDASAWNSNYVAERGIGVAQAGKDGTDYEYIFQRTTTNSRPSTPSTAQQDDYVPSGWTDDPQGVSETYPYEWASMRTKNDGTWGTFCTPYAYGVKGAKGDIGNTGATGAFPYDRGVFKSGQSYVWNSVRRDKVIHLIGGVYYNFLVKNYGATVTVAPTSASGDTNWEAMQKFESIVTDTFFADGANIGGFMFKLKGYTADGVPYGELRSQQDDGNGTPNFYVDTQTGKVYACVAEIKGTIEASAGTIGGFEIGSGRIGIGNGADGGASGMYLYDHMIGFNELSGSTVGRQAIVGPHSILGAKRLGYFKDRQTGGDNVGLVFDISGGTRNFAFAGAGDGALNGLMCGFKIWYETSSSANSVKVINGPMKNTTVVFASLHSSGHLSLPSLESVRQTFFIDSSTDFGFWFTVVGALESTNNFRVYGRSSDFSTAYTMPYLYDQNGGTMSYADMGKGDTQQFFLYRRNGVYNAIVSFRQY